MARPPSFEKKKQDPADVLDYTINWQSKEAPFLGKTEVIDESTWAAYDTGWDVAGDITIDTPASTFTDTTATVWVSEATLGKTYYLTNHIVTDQGREKDVTISLTIEEQ